MPTLEIPSGRRASKLAEVVSAIDITRTYGRGSAAVHALRGVSVEIARAELTALTGPPGSGKSTLLHVLAGVEPPTTGELRIGDVSLRGAKPARMRRHRRAHVGVVYRFFNVLPHLSAGQNILRPFEAAGVEPDLPWVAELLELIGLDDSGTPCGRLSPGDQQKVAIARALALRPTVLFADEPTGTVGDCAQLEILELLRQIVSSHGQTVVLATDDADTAAIADRVVVLADGLVVDDVMR